MKKPNNILAWAACFLLSGFLFSSCSKDEMSPQAQNIANSGAGSQKAANGEFYALTNNNMLVKYAGTNNVKEMGAVAISGLATGEMMLAIDFRPATGQLYGVSSMSKIYVINQLTGAANAMGPAFTPAINGSEVGFDFNPTVDRIRLVTSSTQDLRLHPETGQVVSIDGNLKPGNPEVVAVAYSNSFAGTTSTTLYDIDVKTDKLYIQSPPNDGVLMEVGRLNVQAVGEGGFDISPDNSMAIAVLFGRGGGAENQGQASNGNSYRFYSINLSTGKATNIGKADRTLIGLAIPTNPVAYAVDASNNLMIFNPYMAGTSILKPISGLPSGVRVMGIDMRPVNSTMYAVGSNSQLYTVNLASGTFTAVGSPLNPALNGTYFGFDFNPVADRIRIVSNTGQNLRVNPMDGATIVDGMLNQNSVDACAYTNNTIAPASTMLFTINYMADALYKQDPPNGGNQVLIGNLGVMADAQNGFDIGGISGNAVALLKTGSTSGVYMIDLSTGAATMVSGISGTPESFALGLGF